MLFIKRPDCINIKKTYIPNILNLRNSFTKCKIVHVSRYHLRKPRDEVVIKIFIVQTFQESLLHRSILSPYVVLYRLLLSPEIYIRPISKHDSAVKF